MSILGKLLTAAAVALGLAAGNCLAAAEPTVLLDPAELASQSPAFQNKLRETLDWLDRYLSTEVLFTREDVRQIRDKVARMSPDEFKTWLDETRDLRAQMESPEWQETRDFLHEILTKTKLFSEEQVEEFRAHAREMTPEDLSIQMTRLEQERVAFLQGRSAFQVQRSVELDRGEEVRAGQASGQKSLREASVASRNQTTSAQAAASQKAASSARSSRPLFGSTQGSAAAKPRTYRRPAPLISSESVAREAVHRAIFPGYGWGW